MERYALMLCKQKNVLNIWFIPRFKCPDVCNIVYIKKKCNLFYYNDHEEYLVNILNIFFIKVTSFL